MPITNLWYDLFMATENKIQFAHFDWIDIQSPDQKVIDQLRETYHFHPLDLEDCLKISHRSKIDIYDNYIFLVFIFPIYDSKTREIKSAEINFFISKDYLISIHRGNIQTFNKFRSVFKLSPNFGPDIIKD